MDEDSDRIELVGGSIAGVTAYCLKHSQSTRVYPKGTQPELEYWLHRIPELVLGHTAALLLAQGMRLQDMLAPSCFFRDARSGRVLVEGPYIVLAGTLSKPADPPPRVLDLVFARVRRMPSGMTKEQLLGQLLQEVL